MSINILPGTPETLAEMMGQKFVPPAGEGVVFVKLVMIKPDTMEKGDPAKTIQDAQGVLLCGQLDEIQKQVNEWLAESGQEQEPEPTPQPPQERW